MFLTVQVQQTFWQVHDHEFLVQIKFHNQVITGRHHEFRHVVTRYDKDGVLGLFIDISDGADGCAIGIADFKADEKVERIAVGILVLAVFALSAVQLFVTGVLSLPCIAIFEEVDWPAVFDCWLPILYAGVMSCGIAYTLQIVAQKYTDPTVASLLLSLESVFAVITGMIILGEMMTGRELAGCVIMFCAIILAQLPEKKSAGSL